MQRSLIDQGSRKVLVEIEGLRTLNREQLNQRWRELFGSTGHVDGACNPAADHCARAAAFPRGAVELNRLGDRAVDLIVKCACRRAGLKDKGYSAHSLRAGHVTEALAGGPTGLPSERQTGHASDAMLDRYAREADLFKNNSSGTLGL